MTEENRTTEINTPFSKRSLETAKQMETSVKALRESLNEVVKMTKLLDQSMKAIKTTGFLNPRSSDYSMRQVFQGQQLQGQLQRNQLGFLGTSSGREIAEQKQLFGLIREGSRYQRENARWSAANNLNLRQTGDQLRRINNLEEARSRLQAAEDRAALARAQGNRRQEQSALRIQGVLREHIEALKNQEREQEKLNRRQERYNALLQQANVTLNNQAVRTTGAGLNQDPATLARLRRGEDYLAGQRGARIADAGSAMGQEVRAHKEINREIREGNQLTTSRQRLDAARRLNLNMTQAQVERITTAERVQATLQALKVRQGLAARQGREEEVRQAERLRLLLEQQLNTMREQERIARNRSRQVDRLQNPDREVERLQAEAGRRRKMEGLLGDGGAALFRVQAALSMNYLIMGTLRNAIRDSITFTTELDLALRNLQAITVTTDGGMERLRTTLIAVSEETKFTAVEVANAAVTLGQAGLSVDEIKNSISAVALLATATGTDLARAVDVATATLGVFNLEASQMGRVANVMTSAVNNSKLNIDKLTLGLQYAGNTASQLGMTVEELTAALGAMANSGIRSGSTLGTGMRQILTSLQKPSDTFLANLERLGLTMADVDVGSQGLYGALRNLRDAGFTASDAIQSFEVRGAAAFNAMVNNLDLMVSLQERFQDTSAAMRANETQMRAFRNQAAQFGSVFKSVVATGIEPFVNMMTAALRGTSNFLRVLRQDEGAIRFFTVGITSLGVALGTLFTAKLALGLAAWTLGLKQATAAVVAKTAATKLWAVALGMLKTSLPLIGIALGAGTLAMIAFNREGARSQQTLDILRSQMDDATGAAETTAARIRQVGDEIEHLIRRSESMSRNQNLLTSEIRRVQNQFAAMGLDVSQQTTTIDELIVKLRELRAELSQNYTLDLNAALAATRVALDEYQRQLRDSREAVQARIAAQQSQASDPLASLVQTQPLSNPILREAEALLARPNSTQAQLIGMVGEIQRQDGLRDTDDGKRILEQLEAQTRLLNDIAVLEQRAQEQEQASRVNAQSTRPDVVALTDAIQEYGLRMQPDLGRALDPLRNEDVRPLRRTDGVAEQSQLYRLPSGEFINLPTLWMEMGEVVERSAEESLRRLQRLEDRTGMQVPRFSTMQEGFRYQEAMQAAGNTNPTYAALSGGDTRSAGELSQRFMEHRRVQMEDLRAQLQELEDLDDSLREQINNSIDQHLAEVENAISGSVETLTELNMANAQERVRQLEEAMQQRLDNLTGGETSEERQAIFNMAQELQQARIRVLQLEDKQSEEFAREYAQILAEGDQLEEEITQSIHDAVTAKMDQDIALAEQLQNNALDLAKLSDNMADRIRFLREAQAHADEILRLTLARNAHVLGDKPDERGVANTRAQITRRNTQNSIDSTRRGSGGGRNQQTETQQYVEQTRLRLDSTRALVDANMMSRETAAAEIGQILTTARERLDQVNHSLAAMQSRIMTGDLTGQELERATNLLRDQQALSQLVLEQERELLSLRFQMGPTLGDVVELTRLWAQEALNVGKTLEDGILGTLNNMKSGLVEFFNSWVDGTKSGKEAFRDFALSVIKSIQNIFAEMLATYILQKAMGWLGSAFGIKLPGMNQGGLIIQRSGGTMPKRKNHGGRIPGKLPRDSQHILAEPGEYLLRRSAVQMIGEDTLDQLNAMGNRVYAQNRGAGVAEQSPAAPGMGAVNVYVVAPDQKPVPGPNDIIAVIADDMARNGATKKLVKSIQMGAL